MGQLAELQQECRKVYVDPSLMQYAVKLVSATRRPERYDLADMAKYLTFGASPRATIGLIEGARALAFMRGRSYALPEDMTGLVGDVLRHRLVLSYEALAEGLNADAVIAARHEEDPGARQAAGDPTPEADAMAEPRRQPARRAAGARPHAEALLKRLEWTVIRRLDGLLQGDYRTLLRGAGLDLADLREYQHHDDVRHIDWNVTARLQQPYVRQFTEDRELSRLVPASTCAASVDFGSDTPHQAHASRANSSRVLARLLTRHGNRVGALLYGTEVDTVLPARGGRLHVLRAAAAHGGAGRPSRRPASTDLRDLLHRPAQRIDQAPLAASSSSPTSSARPAGRRRSASSRERHEVTAVRLFDPLEMDLPDLGLVTMRDAETGEQIVVDTHDRGFRKRFAAAAERRETALREAPRPRRRRHPRARHRRRPGRRHPALRRPAQAAQPARQLERRDAVPTRHMAAGAA